MNTISEVFGAGAKTSFFFVLRTSGFGIWSWKRDVFADSPHLPVKNLQIYG